MNEHKKPRVLTEVPSCYDGLMEQGRPISESGDEVNRQKRIASGIARAGFEAAAQPKGLVNLCVDEVVAAKLMRSRWQAAVQVLAPFGVTVADEDEIRSAVDEKLIGRDPLTCVYGDTIVTSFSVMNSNDETRAMIDRFAQSLAEHEQDDPERVRVIVSDVLYTDLSDIEELLPERLRPEPYVPGE